MTMVGFEGGERDHKARNENSLQKWEKTRKQFFPEPPENNAAHQHLKCSPGRPVSDFRTIETAR